MRTVGQRKERPVGLLASGTCLAEGARFNDEMQRLPTGARPSFPKGYIGSRRTKMRTGINWSAWPKEWPGSHWSEPMDATAEYCRPASLEDLKTLIASLNQQQVEYLLIGGYALFVHGYHRATTDIACWYRQRLNQEPRSKQP